MAEGVETASQASILRRLGCDHYQGYYLSRPLTAAKLAEFIEQAAADLPERASSAARIVANG